MVAKLEKELADKKLLVESEGAQVVMLEKFNMPPNGRLLNDAKAMPLSSSCQHPER
jgi:arginyl-tRNA synthetase